MQADKPLMLLLHIRATGSEGVKISVSIFRPSPACSLVCQHQQSSRRSLVLGQALLLPGHGQAVHNAVCTRPPHSGTASRSKTSEGSVKKPKKTEEESPSDDEDDEDSAVDWRAQHV